MRFALERGFVEARLTLNERRTRPIWTDYRPDWNLGEPGANGELQLNGAPVSVEGGARSILPGGTGLVRLYPICPAAWGKVRPGDELAMHEGPHVVGEAIVLSVTLRSPG